MGGQSTVEEGLGNRKLEVESGGGWWVLDRYGIRTIVYDIAERFSLGREVGLLGFEGGWAGYPTLFQPLSLEE